MSVYVDNMQAPFRNMVMCHMFADTPLELLAMADRIDVQRKWIQLPPKASWVHFDIALTKRKLAVQAGAIEVEWRDIKRYADKQRTDPAFALYYP